MNAKGSAMVLFGNGGGGGGGEGGRDGPYFFQS